MAFAMINVVITASGIHSRFRDRGFHIGHKMFLPIGGKSVIQRAVERFLGHDCNIFITVSNPQIKEYVEKSIPVWGFPDDFTKQIRVVNTGLTGGQAHTVYSVILGEKINGPLVVFNADTVVTSKYPCRGHRGKARIECVYKKSWTASEIKFWSFAKIDRSGLLTALAEKAPVGNWACTGLYEIYCSNRFARIYERIFSNTSRREEKDMTSVLLHLLEEGEEISVLKCRHEDVYPAGTPEQYEESVAEWRRNHP